MIAYMLAVFLHLPKYLFVAAVRKGVGLGRPLVQPNIAFFVCLAVVSQKSYQVHMLYNIRGIFRLFLAKQEQPLQKIVGPKSPRKSSLDSLFEAPILNA